jgi:acyl-CoA reductase-like NAD-dependent aldehyde dehydrogenase
MKVQFINGIWCAGDGQPFSTHNGADQRVAWQGCAATIAQVDAAVTAARQAAPVGRTHLWPIGLGWYANLPNV